MYFVYIIKSIKTHKFYVGSTGDLANRIAHHNAGYNKSTKSGAPWKLVYTEEFKNRSDAVKRELEIKSKKSKTYIEKMISWESVPNEIREGHRFEPV